MLIAAERLWQDGALRSGLAIETDGRVITALRPLAGATPDMRVPLLMPGCTDLQVNGGGGVLFNTDPTPEGIAAIAQAHHRLGTAQILPTLITDAPEVMEAAADAILAARELPGIAGIHLEGPHLAEARRGTHRAGFIRPFDAQTLAVLRRLRAADLPVLLTLAPEATDAATLRELVQLGVVVSAGHTTATAAQTRQALEAGLSMFTHLFNAMPQMSSREPGVIAAALLSGAYCGLIADMIHVSPEMLQIAMAARPVPDRMFLVSDAMPTVGGPDHFALYDMDIRVENGRLVNPEGSLAGAHIDMVTSLRRLHQHCAVPVDRAIAMATDIPRRAMGLAPLAIAPGTALRDLIVLDDTLTLMPEALTDAVA